MQYVQIQTLKATFSLLKCVSELFILLSVVICFLFT